MCAAIMAIVLGVSGTAQADDARVILSDIDGRQLGYVDHLDGTDQIRICDTQRDGYTVTGRIRWGGDVRATVSDGSDAGCNYKSVSLIDGNRYVLEIWWNGPGDIDNDREFRA